MTTTKRKRATHGTHSAGSFEYSSNASLLSAMICSKDRGESSKEGSGSLGGTPGEGGGMLCVVFVLSASEILEADFLSMSYRAPDTTS